MTTIVYDHKAKQIACDSRLNADGVILTDSGVKWKKHDNGSVWFFTGNTSDEKLLISLEHNDKPDVIPDCNAIYAKGGDAFLVTFDGGYCNHTKLEYSHAIGSGWRFALSALDFGKTSADAVHHAITRDCYTGGKVRTFDVDKMEFVN